MQMVLNELSAQFPTDSIQNGKDLMERFLYTYSKMKKNIKNDCIILDKEYEHIELAANYKVCQWRNDATVDTDIKRLFRILINKAMPVDKIDFDENKFDIQLSEFTFENKVAIGCLIAYETENIVISFCSDECWNNETIEGQYFSLNQDFKYDEPQTVIVTNVSNEKNLNSFEKEYKSILESQVKSQIFTGEDLWNKKEELFPHLTFCTNVRAQLINDSEPTHIGQILKKLIILEKYFETFNGIFDRNAIANVTTESAVTLEKFKEDHTFKTPDAKELIFSWHIRFTGKYAGRIFFYPDSSSHKCYIGHIGKKLPTVKYN